MDITLSKLSKPGWDMTITNFEYEHYEKIYEVLYANICPDCLTLREDGKKYDSFDFDHPVLPSLFYSYPVRQRVFMLLSTPCGKEFRLTEEDKNLQEFMEES